MTSFIGQALALAGLIATSNGCLVAAAGAVEVGRKSGRHYGDPMGHEYVGSDGEIGWYQKHSNPTHTMGKLEAGMRSLGCDVRWHSEGVFAACPDKPGIVARRDGDLVFRICEPKSDRMECRMAWESVHNAAPSTTAAHSSDAPEDVEAPSDA